MLSLLRFLHPSVSQQEKSILKNKSLSLRLIIGASGHFGHPSNISA